MFKRIIKKIFGGYYLKFREFILHFYLPSFNKVLIKDLSKTLYIEKLQSEFCMKLVENFDVLEQFRINELKKSEYSKFHSFNKEKFDKAKILYFGLYNKDRIVALQWLSVTGYRFIEWGYAVSKDFRKYDIADILRVNLEDYCKNNKISFFVRIMANNKIMIPYLKKRNYQEYLFKNDVYYLKKI